MRLLHLQSGMKMHTDLVLLQHCDPAAGVKWTSQCGCKCHRARCIPDKDQHDTLDSFRLCICSSRDVILPHALLPVNGYAAVLFCAENLRAAFDLTRSRVLSNILGAGRLSAAAVHTIYIHVHQNLQESCTLMICVNHRVPAFTAMRLF